MSATTARYRVGGGSFRLKRIYDEAEPDDGFRVLVDRLWPRSVSRERAAIDEWAKSLAPSPQLRIWYSHLPERFEKFRLTYIEELHGRQEQLVALRERAGGGVVTLLYAARDREHNNAVVLAEVLRDGLRTVARQAATSGR